jgi:hypothetical protein
MVRRAIPEAIERLMREAAQHRCGYCLSPQHLVMARLEIEHIIPLNMGDNFGSLGDWCPAATIH